MGALLAAIDAMQAAVARALPGALASGGRLIARYARANHPYQNRTYRLERATEYQFTEGSFASGYRVRVDGGMPYGSFVEHGTSRNRPYPFLRPAWVAVEHTFAQMVEATMVGAAERIVDHRSTVTTGGAP